MTDLYYLRTDGTDCRLLVGDAGVSHVCWWGNNAVVATMQGSTGFGYYHVPVDRSEPKLLWLSRDGHPGPMDGGCILTDTYPDKYALRHLLAYSLHDQSCKTLGRYPEPLLFHGETQCDLHPSLSPSRRYIQVDCASRHRRAVSIMANPLFEEPN